MLTVKRFEFCYGHFLPDYQGKCKNQHGHNAVLEVTVRISNQEGLENDLDGGMIIDFSELKNKVLLIIEKVDHQNLNIILPFHYLPPTVENFICWFRDEIGMILPSYVYLVGLRLSETPDCWAEWVEEK